MSLFEGFYDLIVRLQMLFYAHMAPLFNKLDLSDALTTGAIILGLMTVKGLYRYVQVQMQVRGLPVIHSFMEFFESGARSKLPHIPFICPVNKYTLDEPWKKYANFQSDLFACTQVTTPSHAVYVTSSPSLASYISAKTSIFLKPVEMFRYKAINIFGRQIVSVQTGEEHKRHRAVVRGCFNEAVMRNVFVRTTEALETMLREEGVEEGGLLKKTREAFCMLTLLVIGSAGYGISIPWHIPETSGMILPFAEALDTVLKSIIAQLLVPTWFMAWFPSAKVRRLARANHSLVYHFKSMIAAKRAELLAARANLPKGEILKRPSDLLGAIVAGQLDVEAEAGTDSKGKHNAGLSPDEVLGNAFIFVVAGHETSGHTLTWTMAYLVLYPEWQEEIFKEVHDQCGDNSPTYRDVPHLRLTLAVTYEALRLRDLVMTLPKLVIEDTILPYTTWDTSGNITHRTRTINAGSHIIIDSPACSRNPFTWGSDVNVFNPRRWLPDPVTGKRGYGCDDFTGFSAGARVCIGKRMAEVEMVAFLGYLIKGYKVHPVEAFKGEGREAMEKRLLTGSEELNFTPANWPVRLEKRM